jgi:SAM-dependent methyltransferase
MDGAVQRGALTCAHDGLVGAILDCRPSFLDRELDRVSMDGDHLLTALDLERDVTRIGTWTTDPSGVRSSGDPDDALVFEGSQRARIQLVGDQGSGTVFIQAEGLEALEMDLRRTAPERVTVTLDDLGADRRRVHIVATGTSREDAHPQTLVARIDTVASTGRRDWIDLSALNRGNPYPDRFIELVGAMPDDAMILDCGGGDRRFGDDRVYNLEYLEFELPDLFGDGLCLPFADDSFDLIMSQAVLEHVPDPQRAVDEMIRVLKPGGQLYVEIAFMQPLHAVPSHYMNVTPHGIAHLCRALEVLESGTFGGLAVTVEWIAQLARAEERLGPDRVQSLLGALRDLDDQLSAEELDQFASAVYLLGRKRPS